MSKGLLKGCWLASLLVSAAGIAEPASRNSVKELLDVTGSSDLGAQMMNQMIPPLRRMVPDAPEQFWIDMIQEIDTDEMVELIIPIYQKYLTEEDLQAINAFNRTSVGRKLISVQPDIMRESIIQGRRWGDALALKMMSKYRQRVRNGAPVPVEP